MSTIKYLLFLALIGNLFPILNAHSFQNAGSLAFEKNAVKKSQIAETQIIQIIEGNYLIVGSFSFLRNAQSYSNHLKKQFPEAKLGYGVSTGFYYVFLYESSNANTVRKERDKLRKVEDFKEAWVLSIQKEQNNATDKNSELAKNEIPNLELKHAPSSVPQSLNTTKTKENISQTSDAPIDLPIERTGNAKSNVGSENKALNDNQTISEYKLYLNVVAANTFKEIPTAVKMIYGEQNKMAGIINAHKTQIVRIPKKGVEEVQLVCDVFGYKKLEQDLNISNPLNEDSKTYVHLLNDTILVDFELIRHKKGDIFTMYNVFFYNDAAIMLPKSIYELNMLVQMATENKNLQIKLHGHTNGNSYGKIIKMSKEDTDFFNISPVSKHSNGSAKELSMERANTIKQYLIQQGIEEARIEVKGWGGRKTLYAKDSPDAKKNVRVEIEILKD